MAIFSEIKCGNCDRRYSSVYSRCPYCHTKKGKLGKHANDNDNTLGKIIICFLIIVVLIVAAIVVVVTAGKEKNVESEIAKPNSAADESVSQVDSAELKESIKEKSENAANEGKKTADKTAENSESVEEKKTDKVEEIKIYLSDGATETSDFTIFIGDYYEPVYDAYPVVEGCQLKFESSDTDVFTVDEEGVVNGVGWGDATLTVSCDGVKAECTVRIRTYEEDYDYDDYDSYDDYDE